MTGLLHSKKMNEKFINGFSLKLLNLRKVRKKLFARISPELSPLFYTSFESQFH